MVASGKTKLAGVRRPGQLPAEVGDGDGADLAQAVRAFGGGVPRAR